jgi:hypothetical protein
MYRDGPEFDILFHKIDGMAARRAQVDLAAKEVDNLSEKQILSSSDDELLAVVQEKLSVAIPSLRRDDISYERKMRNINRQDMWGDRATVEVPVFYFDVPYDGEDVFFTMRPSSYDLNPPRGEARRGVLRIAVQGEEDATKLQQEVNATLASVDQYLTWHRELWAGIEADVANAARGRLSLRRQTLGTLGQTEAGLTGMGFKPKGT